MFARVIVDVAPAHLDRPFDYTVPDGAEVGVGSRVRVTFSGRKRVGWVVETGEEPAADVDRIRPLDAVDGELAWFDAEDLTLLRWVADRWAGTLADVLRHALPQRVAGVEQEVSRWDAPPDRSAALRPPCADLGWRPYGASALLRASHDGSDAAPAFWLRVLPGDDPAALVADLVARCVAGGRDALVLAGDPASPVGDAALSVVPAEARADHRSDRARDRATAFWRGRLGHARVAVGERSAVLAPLQHLGLVVVTDEANPAYKERRSPRHHARDVALARARRAGATAVVTGDLPSADLWRLLANGHVTATAGDVATQRERAPRVDVVDLDDPRPGTRRTRFSALAATTLSDAVRGGGSAVVLASRKGEGSGLACKRCRLRRACPVCEGGLRAGGSEVWECAACGWHGPPFVCADCGSLEHAPLAAGAGRLTTELSSSHPSAEVVRMEGFDAPGPGGRPAIAVMTRGSVVTRPAWLAGTDADVTVIPDIDAMLARPRFDAAEDALRLWFAAGHWSRRMIVQTREPRAVAVQALVRWDPQGFWEREVQWRGELGYPPTTSLVSVTAPADRAGDVAAAVRGVLPDSDELLGPDAAGELLIKTRNRRATVAAVRELRNDWALHGLRVRVDVDPLLSDR